MIQKEFVRFFFYLLVYDIPILGNNASMNVHPILEDTSFRRIEERSCVLCAVCCVLFAV